MITKTILTIALTAILMLGVLAPLAFAEDAVVTDDAGTATDEDTTDSVIAPTPTADTSAETEAELEMDEDVSAGKVAWKQLELWFTFKEDKKVQKELELARLRLIQAKVAAKNGNTEAMEKALEAHERIMDRVQNRVKAMEIVANGENVEAPVAKLAALQTSIAVHERRITFLNNVLANTELTDEQRAKVEARISHVEEVTAKLTTLSEEKREKLVTKIMAVSDMTEEEANAAIDTKEATIRAGIKERIQNKLSTAASDDSSEENGEAQVEVQTETQAETQTQNQAGQA